MLSPNTLVLIIFERLTHIRGTWPSPSSAKNGELQETLLNTVKLDKEVTVGIEIYSFTWLR